MDARALAVIEAIYDAAVDETRWPDALKEFAELTGSQAAAFWVLDGSEQPRLPTFTYINLDPAFINEYLDGMVRLDPTVQYLLAHPNQPIVHDGLVITEREKDRHPYYNWHGRYSDTRFRMVGQVCAAPRVQAGIALHRTRKVGPYQVQDLEQFATLHRHLERALAIGFRLGSLGTMQQCTADILDRNPAAVLLLDEHKRVVYANRRAEVLHADDDGIRLAGRCITLLHKQDNKALQGLIDGCSAPGHSSGGSMRAPRPSGKRPYGILVAPASRRYPALSAFRPAVCVVITDPEGHARLPDHRLQAVFGLTEAEGRLAALLAAGEELRCAAAMLNITYGTARARLAEIFRKTDTRRQGELIQLLLTTVVIG
jgi:DNA-binding CsgD family transcriptional regulator